MIAAASTVQAAVREGLKTTGNVAAAAAVTVVAGVGSMLAMLDSPTGRKAMRTPSLSIGRRTSRGR